MGILQLMLSHADPLIQGVQFVLVGAGGSGGTGSYSIGANYNGGAGGGGGVIKGSIDLKSGAYPIVIGAGGAGVAPGNRAGSNGQSSTAFGYTAGYGLGNSGLTGGTSGAPQSFPGGGGGSYSGGGGGGANGAGAGGGPNWRKAGGVGLYAPGFESYGAAAQSESLSNLSLTAITNGYFGGGGQGAGANGVGERSIGGGGAMTGNSSSSSGTNAGLPNTGGGGAGGYAESDYSGNGGSGILVIRYPGAQKASGGTVVNSGGYTYHVFKSSGVLTI